MTGSRLLKIAALVAALVAPAGLAQAQTGAAAPTRTAPEQAAPQGPEALVIQERRGVRPPPLGADMFGGEAPQASSAVVDPDYILQSGDTVQVTLWGMVEGSHELTIDAQGNVVVPGVGPIRLAGVTASQAPAVVERASRRIYNEGVQVYATPITTASTRVLVTGPVEQPGAFPGASDDALIVYLQRAGGIDPTRGSYRRIRVLRGGEVIARADLYDFLREGVLPRISFRTGDAIVVEEQGSIVSVSGDVRAPFTFELAGQTGQGGELMQFARPQPGATHAAVFGVRDGQPISAYIPLNQFSAFTLMDGDRVQFESDSRPANVLVRVEGAHGGPSVFTEVRGTTVAQILSQVAIDADADMESIHLRRQSVREAQRQTLNEGLERLERTVLLSPARSPAEAQSRATSLAFVTEYIQRARQVEPLGILALSGQDLNQVRVETGDVIVIPRRSQVVTIAGEVNAPQSILAQSGQPVSGYVRAAGGYTSRADRRNVLVFRQDGQLREGGRAMPGDRILVMSKPDSTLLPFLRDLTQTIFQMAGVLVAVDRFSD
ncbi:polysaccharide biosynthesis/export family protein [Brevundimonas sp.]|uniref:polysaccharide biosynthesis/export family protein n=1 Tax=Brevundimonas sp. TaxID=1871086 RepID=UPI001DA35493|nr:polysaccharide biosynthesis/export family protein [Brevundimonas sp.]MBA3999708.1 capsid assembly protein [Brevundimonas sp.]